MYSPFTPQIRHLAPCAKQVQVKPVKWVSTQRSGTQLESTAVIVMEIGETILRKQLELQQLLASTPTVRRITRDPELCGLEIEIQDLTSSFWYMVYRTAWDIGFTPDILKLILKVIQPR
jgi:hypothetical protein